MRNRFWYSWFLLLGALAFSVAPALAQGRGHGRGHGKDREAHGNQGENGQDQGRRFYSRDRQIISRYFAGGYGNLPPGLAKRGGNLPPGLEKQLVRNGHLPPGLEKRLEPLPPDLERRLPPLDCECRRAMIGADVVIVNPRTMIVVDIFRGAIVLGYH